MEGLCDWTGEKKSIGRGSWVKHEDGYEMTDLTNRGGRGGLFEDN